MPSITRMSLQVGGNSVAHATVAGTVPGNMAELAALLSNDGWRLCHPLPAVVTVEREDMVRLLLNCGTNISKGPRQVWSSERSSLIATLYACESTTQLLQRGCDC